MNQDATNSASIHLMNDLTNNVFNARSQQIHKELRTSISLNSYCDVLSISLNRDSEL